eukprot:7378479-Prymnesium_polylepis.2
MMCGDRDFPSPRVPPAKLIFAALFVARALPLSSWPALRPCLPPTFLLPAAYPPRWGWLLELAAGAFPALALLCPRRLPGAFTSTLRVADDLPRLDWSARTSVSSMDTSRFRPSGNQKIISSYGLFGSNVGL